LTEVARALGRAPVIVPGPVLLLGGHETGELRAAVAERWPQLAVVSVTPDDLRRGPVDSIDDASAPGFPGVAHPVLELPSGVRVGAWSECDTPSGAFPGFLAVPGLDAGEDESWLLRYSDASTESVVEYPGQAPIEQSLVKVPGWIGGEIRKGGPAGLLVEGAAHDGERKGRPLWVSNVGPSAVRFLLSLPGPIWVDGPGVPE
jgi:hypothetical protein